VTSCKVTKLQIVYDNDNGLRRLIGVIYQANEHENEEEERGEDQCQSDQETCERQL
jgi:hypothetical protein